MTDLPCKIVLRHDPDVVMIGEIRDRETADVAIKAALTGHLVFSTLHTNDAPSAITRLVDMGVKRFLVSTAVIFVVNYFITGPLDDPSNSMLAICRAFHLQESLTDENLLQPGRHHNFEQLFGLR